MVSNYNEFKKNVFKVWDYVNLAILYTLWSICTWYVLILTTSDCVFLNFDANKLNGLVMIGFLFSLISLTVMFIRTVTILMDFFNMIHELGQGKDLPIW